MMRTDDEDNGPRNGLATGDAVARFEIWPHRSLDARATRIVVILAVALVVVAFIRSPSPYVLPLIIGPLLAVAALAFAFRCNNRSAARTGELVEIGRDVVRITRRSGGGVKAPVEFATGWVRLSITQDRDVANRITLRQSGRSCSIGECLSPDERADLARALENALAEARRTIGAA